MSVFCSWLHLQLYSPKNGRNTFVWIEQVFHKHLVFPSWGFLNFLSRLYISAFFLLSKLAVAEGDAWVAYRVISGMWLCVCLCIVALKRKRLELWTPNLEDRQFMAALDISETMQSRLQGCGYHLHSSRYRLGVLDRTTKRQPTLSLSNILQKMHPLFAHCIQTNRQKTNAKCPLHTVNQTNVYLAKYSVHLRFWVLQ